MKRAREYRAEAASRFIRNENEDYPENFPLGNLTAEQADAVVACLDAEQPGWDANFWFEDSGMISPDTAWDSFIPVAARMFPALLKPGNSIEDL
jgi:hypothetical protein